MQTIFYHNSSGGEAFTGNLKQKEVHRAITLHPVKHHSYMYRIHNYMKVWSERLWWLFKKKKIIFLWLIRTCVLCTITLVESRAPRHPTEEDTVAPGCAGNDRPAEQHQTSRPPETGQRVRPDRKLETLHVPARKSGLLGWPGSVG